MVGEIHSRDNKRGPVDVTAQTKTPGGNQPSQAPIWLSGI
jgi:hypothetical protein